MVRMTARAVSEYENAFSGILHAPLAFTFWKGRTALFAILRALGIGPGDEVILPAFTCVVVPNAIRFTGATPVYADIAPNTYNIDPEDVCKKVTSKTCALIIQHSFGIPAELDSLLEVAKLYDLPVIEDCAHALGSRYRAQQVGTFGKAAFFSSQWSKPYTTGLGGIAVTSDVTMGRHLKT